MKKVILSLMVFPLFCWAGEEKELGTKPPVGFGTGKFQIVDKAPRLEDIIDLVIKSLRNNDYQLYSQLFDSIPLKNKAQGTPTYFEDQREQIKNIESFRYEKWDQVFRLRAPKVSAPAATKDVFRFRVYGKSGDQEDLLWNVEINRYSHTEGDCAEMKNNQGELLPLIYDQSQFKPNSNGCWAFMKYKVGAVDKVPHPEAVIEQVIDSLRDNNYQLYSQLFDFIPLKIEGQVTPKYFEARRDQIKNIESFRYEMRDQSLWHRAPIEAAPADTKDIFEIHVYGKNGSHEHLLWKMTINRYSGVEGDCVEMKNKQGALLPLIYNQIQFKSKSNVCLPFMKYKVGLWQ